MLCLHRKSGECVLIGDDIKVCVSIVGNKVKLAIDAPKDVKIVREELKDRAIIPKGGVR